MGFLSGFWDKGGFGQDLVGGATAAFGGPILGAAGGMAANKVFGIPKAKTGQQLGQDQLDFMNRAFPGTNPWERLGSQSSGSAGVESAKFAQNAADKRQDKELGTATMLKKLEMKNQLNIAGVHKQSAENVATIAHSPERSRELEMERRRGLPKGKLAQKGQMRRAFTPIIKKPSEASGVVHVRAKIKMLDAVERHEILKRANTWQEGKVKSVRGSLAEYIVKVGLAKDVASVGSVLINTVLAALGLKKVGGLMGKLSPGKGRAPGSTGRGAVPRSGPPSAGNSPKKGGRTFRKADGSPGYSAYGLPGKY